MPRKKSSHPKNKECLQSDQEKNRGIKERKKRVTKKAETSKVPKTRNNGTLTEAQYWAKIRSGLRSAFRFWIPMQEALKKASRPSQSTNKRLKTEYQCNHCKAWFPRSMVEIDHKEPCGSIRCMDDIPGFIERLTVEDVNSYQILCKAVCHRKKTLEEVAERKRLKDKEYDNNTP